MTQKNFKKSHMKSFYDVRNITSLKVSHQNDVTKTFHFQAPSLSNILVALLLTPSARFYFAHFLMQQLIILQLYPSLDLFTFRFRESIKLEKQVFLGSHTPTWIKVDPGLTSTGSSELLIKSI